MDVAAPAARPKPAQLAEIGRFIGSLTAIHDALDEANRLIVEEPDGTNEVKLVGARESSERAMRMLDPTLERVRELFGEGEASQAADAAMSAAQARIDVIQEPRLRMTLWRDREQVVRVLDAARAEAAVRLSDFERLARAALSAAVEGDGEQRTPGPARVARRSTDRPRSQRRRGR
jgi:hypothetical protein